MWETLALLNCLQQNTPFINNGVVMKPLVWLGIRAVTKPVSQYLFHGKNVHTKQTKLCCLKTCCMTNSVCYSLENKHILGDMRLLVSNIKTNVRVKLKKY